MTTIILILLTVLWLLLIVPAGMLTMATIMSVANMGSMGQPLYWWHYTVGWTFILSTGLFPFVAVIMIIVAWVLFSQDHTQAAQIVMLLPALNWLLLGVSAYTFFNMWE